MSFALVTVDLLERRATLEDGVVFAPAPGAPPHDAELPPLLTVAWLDEPPETTLDDVEAEDLPRALDAPGGVLLDREPVELAGVPALRTFILHRAAGRPAASEQWRLLTHGRRWTVSAMSALADQPEWGPRLAAVAATLKLA